MQGAAHRRPRAPAVPGDVTNPPGQPAIRYRIGTFASFRQAMFDSLQQGSQWNAGDGPFPFAGWHEGIAGDYQSAFLELWAYLADVLTFYQERIANEAYLPTATQSDALRRLVRLVNYRPFPGSGATVLEVVGRKEHDAGGAGGLPHASSRLALKRRGRGVRDVEVDLAAVGVQLHPAGDAGAD